MKWVVVAVPLVLLALFPVLVLAADRMRPDRPAPAPKVRAPRTRPIPVPATVVTAVTVARAAPAPELSNLERARVAWAELVGERSGHEQGDH